MFQNMKKNFICLAIISAVIIITISFIIQISVKQKSDGVQFVIGMSQANLTEPWRILMNEEIQIEEKKYKNIKIVYRDAGGDTDKQKRDIDDLVSSGIDLLIVSMNDSEKLTPEVSEVYKSIPVIVLDRAAKGSDYTLYIGPDNESIGKQAGKLALDLLEGKKGKIVEVQGLLNSNPVIERSKGFRDVLKKYGNIDTYRTVTSEWRRDEAEDKVKEILKESKDIDVIFAHNDYMAFGAYKAAYDLGIKDIKIIGVDGITGENGGLDLVSKGILNGTFTCPTGGKQAVDYAVDILNKKRGIPKKIMLRSDRITKSNIDEYLNNKSKKPVNQKKIVLGYAELKFEGKWRDANAQSIKNAAKEAGMDLIFLESGITQEDEKRSIRELIKRKVDVICFSPFVKSGWEDVLKEAKEAGIPVIISDRAVDSDDSFWVSSICSDFYEEGRIVAKLLLDNFKDKQLNILQIKGNSDATPTIDREKGFREMIEQFKQCKVIESVTGEFSYEGGKKAMEDFLSRNGSKINVVYAQNDDMALGAVEAIKQYGLVPGKDIIVLSIDGTRKALLAVKKEELYCTVECNPLIGPQIVKIASQILNQEEVPLRIIHSEELFTKNVTYKEILSREY